MRFMFHLFNSLAEETWFKLERSSRSPTTFGENSITDHNLFAVYQHAPRIRLRHYNQNEEATVGADWEWWIGNVVDGWIVLRIQAKRVRDRSYPELAHAALDDTFQYDTLIASCDREGGEQHSTYPLMVFYNGWGGSLFGTGDRWPHDAVWRACRHGQTQPHCACATVQQYGCAVASARSIKRVHEHSGRDRLTRRVAPHLSESQPWSYLWQAPHVPAGTAASAHMPEWQWCLQGALVDLSEPSNPDVDDWPRAPADESRRLRQDLPGWARALLGPYPGDEIDRALAIEPLDARIGMVVEVGQDVDDLADGTG